MTATDLAGSVTMTRPPRTVPLIGFGATAFGAAKVLTEYYSRSSVSISSS